MRLHWVLQLVPLGLFAGATLQLSAQRAEGYGRTSAFSVAVEYSNNSNSLVGGGAYQRKWAAATLGYERRLVARHGLSVSYLGEVRPLVFESDPVTHRSATYAGPIAVLLPPPTSIEASCRAGVQTIPVSDPSGNPAGNLVVTTRCDRRWTYGGAVSPAGFRLNALMTSRLQPYLLGTLGVLLTTRPVPATEGTSANFLIQLGLGVELYRTLGHSIFAEYRVQHFSNDDRSNINPGVDSQMVHVGFSFGR